MRSTLGKARGLALRVSLVLEFLWWAADPVRYEPPTVISEAAFAAATRFIGDYAMPMAERTFGDATALPAERDAATLARWINKPRETHLTEVNVTDLRRKVRLPGLLDAKAVHAAASILIEAGWLFPMSPGRFQAKGHTVYPINPRLWDVVP